MSFVPYFLLFILTTSHGAKAFPGRPGYREAPVVPSAPLLANKSVCISGAGPCGLFLAALLLRTDPTVRIAVLEKAARGEGGVNAFGIGLSPRLLHSLEAVPGLREEVESIGAEADLGAGLKIASRADLSERMARFLTDAVDEKGRCRIRYGEGCADVDLERKEVTTTSGRRIPYDLLIGADGINSVVRRTLVERRGLEEVRYLEPSLWKALRLPPQPHFDAKSVKPLRHPRLRGGRLLPRNPEGHVLLCFWSERDGVANPGNASTAEELKGLFTDALQDVPQRRSAVGSLRLLGARKDQDVTVTKRVVRFDDRAVDLFLKTRPGRSHYMKANRFHDDSVALVGDAAHGMSSLLGQGCAVGLKCAALLAEELGSESNGLDEALRRYSERAVPGAHAITDLNHVGAALLRAGRVVKLLVLPFVMLQMLLRRTIFQQLARVDVSYERILRENWFLIPFAWLQWRRDRVPYPTKA